uniref:NADH-ubiquinone oxidoreductase chain 2 n=1 Tax=Curculionoidea sp. 2 KM-2017 TaxID=2219403 RepID=A0A346RKM4_9CUCU|nr:NADH dehydrogenase subunit 2 [Curculionoidea sp. 2 KM-2017]
MFINTVIISTLISISSMSWFTAWIGLEINLLSLMPLMKSFKNKYSSEATIKYFIVQAMASAILLFSILIFNNSKILDIYPFSTPSSIILCSALLLKLGASPFHFWFPEVLSGLNWEMVIILLTWQKIAPMILLSYMTNLSSKFLSIIIILSSIFSGLQGLNQICMRKILAYSSINHMGWMISAIFSSMSIWTYYFLSYCIINLNFIIMMNSNKIFYFNQLGKLFSFNKKFKFMFMTNLLSLSGLPPFLGFYPKWITVNFMIKNNHYTMIIMLIILTLLSLYYYLRITMTSFIFNYTESLIYMKPYKFYYTYMFINFIALTSLIFCTMLLNNT